MQLSLDLVGEWLASHLRGLELDGDHPSFNVNGLTTYHPFDGVMDLKIVSLIAVNFLSAVDFFCSHHI